MDDERQMVFHILSDWRDWRPLPWIKTHADSWMLTWLCFAISDEPAA